MLSFIHIRRAAIRNNIIINYIQGWKEKSLLISFSLPSLLSGIMVSPIKWSTDAILVSNAGFIQMGILTAAFTFQNLILMGANMLDAPFIAVMAKNKNSNKNSLLSKMNILVPWIMGVAIALPLMAFPELASAIFGNDYIGKDFQWTFIIISLFTIIIMFKQGLARILAVFDLQWWGVFSNLIWGIILLCVFLLMKTHNAFTLAISYLIAYIVNTLMLMPLYFKKNLVPKGTILSIQAFIIWGLIIIIAITGIFVTTIILKVAIFAVVTLLVYLSFRKLISQKLDEKNTSYWYWGCL